MNDDRRERISAADAIPAVGAPPSAAFAIAETSAWLDRVVIGLDLCPYAPAVRRQGRVRIVHTDATEVEALLEAFCDEVRRLLETPAGEVETTLLVHPRVLLDFDDYNDFLDVADAALDALGA